jgi:hypothetical protein
MYYERRMSRASIGRTFLTASAFAFVALSAVACGGTESPAPVQSQARVESPPAPTLKAGDTAPAFRLQGSDGKEHALADHVGHEAVVLAWFPKAFTGG